MKIQKLQPMYKNLVLALFVRLNFIKHIEKSPWFPQVTLN